MGSLLHHLLVPLYLLTFFNCPHVTAADKCETPLLDNGLVEVEEEDQGTFMTAKFRCSLGFTLSGPSLLKCRRGIWSGSKPMCTVSGCDPQDLPHFANGRKQAAKKMRGSVMRYKCNKGFRLYGSKNVYCTKTGWKLDTIPVCAKFGCDENMLLGTQTPKVPHGRYRIMFHGAVYRFQCESGTIMEGDSAVFCDGQTWNGTKPLCLVPPAPPKLSVKLNGIEVSEPVATVGQQLTLVCNAQGGNPFPSLSFMLNGETVEADNRDMIEYGYEAVHSFTVEEHHANLEMSCTARNKMASIPVASNHQTLSVKFAPRNSYIHGAEMIKPGDDVEYSCSSDESNPASDLTVQITDQDGNNIDIDMTKFPKMKGNTGFASLLVFKFHVQPTVKSVFMRCEADNGVGLTTTGLAVPVLYPPTNIQISGPAYLLRGMDNSQPDNQFTCHTAESNPVANIDWVVDTAGTIDITPEHSTAVETFNQGLGSVKISTLSLPVEAVDSIKVHCVATIEELGYSDTSEIIEVDVLTLPGRVSISGPELVSPNSVVEFQCIQDEDQNKSEVHMEVTDLHKEPLNSIKESKNKISVTLNESPENFIVECFAENLVGRGPVDTKSVNIEYTPTANKILEVLKVLDQSQSPTMQPNVEVPNHSQSPTMQLNVEVPDQSQSPTMQLTGPPTVLAGYEATFKCMTHDSYPEMSLQWTLDGKDVTADADQTDKMEDDEAITTTSVLQLKPTMSGHEHTLRCSVRGRDVSEETQFVVEDLSVELSGVKQGAEVTEEVYQQVSCSLQSVPGFTSVQWYVDGEMADETNLVQENGKLVANWTWWPSLGDTVLECRPKGEGMQPVRGDSVNFEVLEEEYGYGEDFYLDEDYQDYGNYEEDANIEEKDNVEGEETHYQIKDVYEENQDSQIEEGHSSDSQIEEGHNSEFKFETDQFNQENYDSHEDYMKNEQIDTTDEFSYDDSNDKSSATEYKDGNVATEDLMEESYREQNFAAPDPGPSVLVHDSEASEHNTVDLFSSKTLSSSAQTRVPISLIFCIILISSIKQFF